MNEILNGNYRKLKRDPIGHGSQSKVFLCEDLRNDKKKYSKRSKCFHSEKYISIIIN